MLPSWAVVTPARRAHIERVAALVEQWATTMHVSPAERARWLRAAWLHDALRDAPFTGEMDHGPRCAERLAREGERDQGVLDAVRFHSVGYAGWDEVGRMLYLADHLEPGRPHEADIRAGLRARVAGERDTILKEVARRRIDWTLRSGWPLQPETVAFWNALVTS